MSAATRTMVRRLALLAALLLAAPAMAETSEPAPTPKVSAEQAKAAALKSVSGRVTSVDIEKKKGKFVYVVEIKTRAGEEKDVLVDIDTGLVLAVED